MGVSIQIFYLIIPFSHFLFISLLNLWGNVQTISSMKIMVLLAIMSNILGTCEKGAANDTISNLPPSIYFNVSYGSDPKQVMDIYLPAGRTTASTKVMFLIHGGSWSGGDKKDFRTYIDSIKKYLPHYAIVNVNYRLANYSQNRFPTQENDIKAALTFVMNKSGEYAISENVVLLGASAGAHLALLQAYKYAEPVKVKAVVSFFGPSDIAEIYNNPVHPQVPMLLQVLLGGTPAENPEIYHQSSPVYFVTPETCPTLLFQGGMDPLVSPRQSALLKDKLQKAGVANKLIVYPNEGHGWRGLSLGDSFKHITGFLKVQVK